METGITESYELQGSKGGITVRLILRETYDLTANISTLSVSMAVKSSAYYKYTYYLTGSLKVAGITVAEMDSTVPTHYVTPAALNTYYRVRAKSDSYTESPWTVENIPHLTDGSLTVPVELTLKGYTTGGGGGSGWSVADSRQITLTHIPRANPIGASDAYIGAVSTVSVVRRSQDYTHSVAYTFGQLSGWLDESGNWVEAEREMTAVSIPFTLPESFYEQIPDAPSGICTLTCRTYYQGAQVGEAQTCQFTATARRELCAPTLTVGVTDGNEATLALTGDEGKLVRFHSNAVCTAQAEAQNGASIREVTVCGEVLEDTLTFREVETGTFPFVATDSRGYATEVTAQQELIPYIRLTANAVARRDDPTSGNVTLTVTGSCFQGSFGAAENTLTLTCRVNGGEALTLTPTWQEGSYTAALALTGLDYQSSHTLEVTATDLLEQVVKTAVVGKGIPVFDWGEADFCFHVPVSLPALTVAGESLEAYIQRILEGG